MAQLGYNLSHYTRPTPRVRFVQGYDATSAHSLSEVLPIKSGVTITSGDLIVKAKSTTGVWEWVLADSAVYGSNASNPKGMIFIAKSDSTDTDVLSAGKLTGVPINQPMVIATGSYDATKTYVTGDLLTIGTNTNDTTAGKAIPLTAQLAVSGTGDTKTITSNLVVGMVNNGVESWSNTITADRMPSDASLLKLYTPASMADYLFLPQAVWGTLNTGAGTDAPTPANQTVIAARSGVTVPTNTAISEANKLAIIKGRYVMDYGRGTAINSESAVVNGVPVTMLNFSTLFLPKATGA